MAADWLTLALGVLPPAPADLSVLRAEGGEAQVRLLGHSDRGLLVRMAAADADTTSGVTFVLDRPAGRRSRSSARSRRSGRLTAATARC
jgi:hypothetical protein